LRLLDLASWAYARDFDHETQRHNLANLAQELGERQFESGTRRQFVKAAVTLIESQRRSAEHRLSPDEIRALAGGHALLGSEPMAGEVEF
jgi:hypothetical protein